jgi:sugar phosphate isomerase/epimerase
MIGISTCWRSAKTENGLELIDMMRQSGLEHIELEYRITNEMYWKMRPMLKKKNPEVVSIHNYFPIPDIFPHRNMGGGSAFPLSSLDKEERRLAIKYTKQTIQIANDLEAKAVVLHLGNVEMNSGMMELFRLFDDKLIDSPEGQAFIQTKKKERKKKRDKHLDSVSLCLDKIIEEAMKLGILLGIENAYKINGIPDIDEIGLFLEKFNGAPIGYWHDVGHGQAKENLGWHNHSYLLKTYKDYMIGIHLHDIIGYGDHLAPGLGKFNFSSLNEYVNENIIKIIEVNDETSEKDLQNGIDFLRKHGFE